MTIHLIDQHKNDNGIQVGELSDVGEGKIEAGNALTPGMICTKGTAAGELIPDNASGKALGFVLGNYKEGAATLRTAFVAADLVRYGRNGKFMGLVASGQTLVKGDLLSTAAGKLIVYAAGNAVDTTQLAVARCIQEGGTGGALGADGHFLCQWGL